ncbi:MAG: YdcF family protein [Candidatus Promineifilaceae bacterium]|nr:YdcF family protein [Candidatus Promineifilaceae bacterium]
MSKRKLEAAWTTVRFAASIILALVIISGLLYIVGEAILIVSESTPSKVDLITVLGSPAESDGTPSEVMKARVEKGVMLYQAGLSDKILFQGGAVANEFVEAQVMAQYARSLGISSKDILLDRVSRDTLENVQQAISIMNKHGWKSAIVVSSPYHTRRVDELFRARTQVDVIVIAADHPPDWPWHERIREIIHEYVVFAWYWLTDELKES